MPDCLSPLLSFLAKRLLHKSASMHLHTHTLFPPLSLPLAYTHTNTEVEKGRQTHRKYSFGLMHIETKGTRALPELWRCIYFKQKYECSLPTLTLTTEMCPADATHTHTHSHTQGVACCQQ